MKVIYLTIIGLLCSSYPCTGQMHSPEQERVKTEYRAAVSEKAKMAVCIEAIDAGLIKHGTPIQTIDWMFGSTLAKNIPVERDRTQKGAINFARQREARSEAVANPYVGWFLGVEFNSEGRVIRYCLSNSPK